MTPPSTRLTSAQVAARLDVKPATLYAYVSRGLLRSARAENGGSTFDPLDVEAFAASRRRGSRSGGSSAGRPLTVVESDLTQDGGCTVAQRLLDLASPPTAIVACNDAMAIGAMQAIRACGLTVGRDIAVAGFDDIPTAAFTDPPLTTVRQPIYDIGRRALDMLICAIRRQPLDEAHVLLVPELIVRQSSGAPLIR